MTGATGMTRSTGMTGNTVVGAPPLIPMPSGYGVITSDITGLGEIRNLVGGDGTALWKQVVNGMHLPGGWGCVEYVELRPGSSCGRHLHAEREEIYYILTGAADMTVNGDELTVVPGDLVTCPLGTIHGIGCPADAEENMSFFVVEMSPGSGPPKAPVHRIPVPAELGHRASERGGDHRGETLVADIDLTAYLTGPWRRFSLVEIPVGGIFGERLPADMAEVLFVVGGDAEITAAGAAATGGRGLTVGTSLGAAVAVKNTGTSGPLTVISTQAAA